MDLFRKKDHGTKCNKCNLDCYSIEKLKRHKDIAHKDHDTTREGRRALAKGKGQFG